MKKRRRWASDGFWRGGSGNDDDVDDVASAAAAARCAHWVLHAAAQPPPPPDADTRDKERPETKHGAAPPPPPPPPPADDDDADNAIDSAAQHGLGGTGVAVVESPAAGEQHERAALASLEQKDGGPGAAQETEDSGTVVRYGGLALVAAGLMSHLSGVTAAVHDERTEDMG